MIGRFTREGTLAQVGPAKLAQVGLAGILIVAAAAVRTTGTSETILIALCLASLSLTGFPIIWEAVRGLVKLQTNVDELVSIAILASLFLGEWISAAIVAFIMVLGGLIEELTGERARRHLEALTAASPREAIVISPDGETTSVPVADLEVGQRVLVRPGDVVPADGVVEVGASEIDESSLTGESLPVAKEPGAAIASGTINLDGSLEARVSRVGKESTHERVRRIVKEAERHRAPVLRVAERYARWFTPSILILSALVFAVTGDPHRAVTMLIVGCPCAFVLATPTAVVAALGRASREGILIKGGLFLESAAQVRAVALDKTGTLTTGRYEICEIVSLDGVSADRLLIEAARLEGESEHPIAHAIISAVSDQGLESPPAATIRRIPGLGIEEQNDEDGWSLGNARMMERRGAEISDSTASTAQVMSENGLTPVFVAEGRQLCGILALKDEFRPEVPDTISRLNALGFEHPVILTGDLEHAANRLARDLQIPAEHVHAQLLPEDKYHRIREMEDGGNMVCYVGDGTNDGPALAIASVGVSIGSRRDTIALETADAVLMRGDLRGLPFLLRLGRATARTINTNLVAFGLVFNASMLVLSAGGYLTPILGAIAHNLGSVAVVLNSARLLRFR